MTRTFRLTEHNGEYIGANTARLMGICGDCGAVIKHCDCDDQRPSRDSSRERVR